MTGNQKDWFEFMNRLALAIPTMTPRLQNAMAVYIEYQFEPKISYGKVDEITFPTEHIGKSIIIKKEFK